MAQLRFFNPYAEIRHTENRLPHWQQSGAVYFITFRLADSIPNNLREDWERDREAWLNVHPQPWSSEIEQRYHERFSGMIERWLDSGYGSCVLLSDEIPRRQDWLITSIFSTKVRSPSKSNDRSDGFPAAEFYQ